MPFGITSLIASTLLTTDSDVNSSIQGLPIATLPEAALCFAINTEKYYRWDPESTLTADDVSIILPDSSPAAGRWLIVPSFSVDEEGNYSFSAPGNTTIGGISIRSSRVSQALSTVTPTVIATITPSLTTDTIFYISVTGRAAGDTDIQQAMGGVFTTPESGGITSLIPSVEQSGAYDVDFTQSGNDILITVTGPATSYTWNAFIEISER